MASPAKSPLGTEAVVIDLAARVVRRADRVLPLKERAFDLLVVLARQTGQVVSNKALEQVLWPRQRISPSSLRTQILLLRRQLGPHAVRNVAGRGYQLTLAAQWDEAAPTVAAYRPRLPSFAQPLLGRDEDLDRLVTLMQSHALVSVLGPGGIGKTRLAQAAARRFEQLNEGQILWVDLATLPADRAGTLSAIQARGPAPATAATVCHRVAQVCGLQLPQTDGTPTATAQALGRALARPAQRQALLLLLDNAEHLADTLRPLVAELLAGALGLRVLLTSQHALRLPAEQTYWLDALAVPGADAGPGDVRHSPAVQLLLQHATAADQRWTLPDADWQAAAELVRCLDGIPLAIEMAAVRLPLLGAPALRLRLAEGVRGLGRNADAQPARHRTLRATLDWSFGLLSEAERAALVQLSVFAAPFRLEAAAAVVAVVTAVTVPGRDRLAVEQIIQHLVDHSLLQWQPAGASGAPPRLRLLEATRQHATEALQRSGPGAAADCQRRHAQAMATLATAACADFLHASDGAWTARWVPEQPDLMRAFDTAHANGDADTAAALIETLVLGANVTGDLQPALQRWQATRDLALHAAPAARARLLGWGNLPGAGATRRGQSEQRVQAWRALAPDAGRQGLCVALAMHATVCQDTGDPTSADAALTECLQLEGAAWPPRLRRRCSWIALTRLAIARSDAALLARAERQSQVLAAELAQQGAWREVTLIRGQQALMLHLQQRLGEAARLLHDTAQLQLLLGCSLDAGRSLGQACAAWLAEHHAAGSAGADAGQGTREGNQEGHQDGADEGTRQGPREIQPETPTPRLAAATQAAREALQLLQPHPSHLQYCIDALAELALLHAEPELCARLLAGGQALREALNVRPDALNAGARQRALQALPGWLDDAERLHCERQGRELEAHALLRLAWQGLPVPAALATAPPPP